MSASRFLRRRGGRLSRPHVDGTSENTRAFEVAIGSPKVRSTHRKISPLKVSNFGSTDRKFDQPAKRSGSRELECFWGRRLPPLRFSQARGVSAYPGFPGRRHLSSSSVSSAKGGISSSLTSTEFPETFELSKLRLAVRKFDELPRRSVSPKF